MGLWSTPHPARALRDSAARRSTGARLSPHPFFQGSDRLSVRERAGLPVFSAQKRTGPGHSKGSMRPKRVQCERKRTVVGGDTGSGW